MIRRTIAFDGREVSTESIRVMDADVDPVPRDPQLRRDLLTTRAKHIDDRYLKVAIRLQGIVLGYCQRSAAGVFQVVAQGFVPSGVDPSTTMSSGRIEV